MFLQVWILELGFGGLIELDFTSLSMANLTPLDITSVLGSRLLWAAGHGIPLGFGKLPIILVALASGRKGFGRPRFLDSRRLICGDSAVSGSVFGERKTVLNSRLLQSQIAITSPGLVLCPVNVHGLEPLSCCHNRESW